MDALISIIIPIYNMERYLARCLDSVINNTYRNLEIICVDDGSTDRSAEILREYAQKDSRIVPIFKENGGVSSARNAGLDRMTGDYVTFIDSDDFVHPQYIEIMAYAITKAGADLVITKPIKLFSNDSSPELKPISLSSINLNKSTRKQVYRNLDFRSYCVCKLVKSSFAASCRFQIGYTYGEDIIFFASIWENNPSLQCFTFSAPLYFYYQGNPNSAVANSTEHEMLKATRYCLGRCSLSRENEQIYLYMCISQCIWHRYYGSVIRGDRTVVKECRPLLRDCWKRMIASPDFSRREKLLFTVKMFLHPLYLLYKRRNPEYRKWERAEKLK